MSENEWHWRDRVTADTLHDGAAKAQAEKQYGFRLFLEDHKAKLEESISAGLTLKGSDPRVPERFRNAQQMFDEMHREFHKNMRVVKAPSGIISKMPHRLYFHAPDSPALVPNAVGRKAATTVILGAIELEQRQVLDHAEGPLRAALAVKAAQVSLGLNQGNILLNDAMHGPREELANLLSVIMHGKPDEYESNFHEYARVHLRREPPPRTPGFNLPTTEEFIGVLKKEGAYTAESGMNFSKAMNIFFSHAEQAIGQVASHIR